MSQYLPATARKWLYGVLLAAVPILIIYGVLDSEAAPLWVALAGAILGPGVALAHTPAPEDYQPAAEATDLEE